jgi:branched-chain amino acid aminotransferase
MTSRATSATRSTRRSLVRTDLFLADEAFLTGTAAELTPIREVEGRKLGPAAR